MKQAERYAEDQLGPLRAMIEDQQKRAEEQARRRNQDVQGFSQAAAEMLKGVAPAIQQTYGQEANRQASFAQGYSDAFKALQNDSAGELNKILETAGTGQTVSGDKGGADVLYGLGGLLPAAGLLLEG